MDAVGEGVGTKNQMGKTRGPKMVSMEATMKSMTLRTRNPSKADEAEGHEKVAVVEAEIQTTMTSRVTLTTVSDPATLAHLMMNMMKKSTTVNMVVKTPQEEEKDAIREEAEAIVIEV